MVATTCRLPRAGFHDAIVREPAEKLAGSDRGPSLHPPATIEEVL
jgi:hypothetical protein